MCQNSLRPFFGLGAQSMVERIEIRWPDGAVQILENVAADQILTVYQD